MRVIAGNHKGRQLKAVPGKETRPTGDKIKEAVFHRMGPFFAGGAGLDLFAGSGALGMEALSRGMDELTFIDTSSQAVRTIQHNISLLHVEAQCKVFRNDAFRALELLHKQEKTFKLILLDPPYAKINYQLLINQIEQYQLVSKNGLVYIEHGPDNQVLMTEGEYQLIFDRKYNETTQVSIFEKI